MIVAVLLAVPLGVIAAARAGSWIDRLVMLFSVLGFSVPVFLIAYLPDLRLSRSSSTGCRCRATRRLADGVGPVAAHLMLPCVDLAPASTWR